MQSARGRLFAGLSPNTYLLALASLFADISTEMQYPVLPTFLTQTLGANGTIVGFIDGCAQALQNIVGGQRTLSDRLQRRKPIAPCGYCCGIPWFMRQSGNALSPIWTMMW